MTENPALVSNSRERIAPAEAVTELFGYGTR